MQSLFAGLLQVSLTWILRCSASSDAAKLLWLSAEIALPSCLLALMSLSALSCFQGMLLTASLALCQAWFWLRGNAKIIEGNTCVSGEGLRENRRAWSKRGHPRWKQMQSVMGRELTMVRLWKGAWSKPGFAEEQLQPGAVSSGVKEWEENLKKPVESSGEFWYRHLLLDLIEKWLAKMFGTNFNGHRVYQSALS